MQPTMTYSDFELLYVFSIMQEKIFKKQLDYHFRLSDVPSQSNASMINLF